MPYDCATLPYEGPVFIHFTVGDARVQQEDYEEMTDSVALAP